MTMDRIFWSLLLRHEVAAAPKLLPHFLPYCVPQEGLYPHIINILCINYVTIMCINNNAVLIKYGAWGSVVVKALRY
jgi:tRNA splicing ligase